MLINQGDVFWIDLQEGSGSDQNIRFPHIVIQNNVFNSSRINTVVVCPLTTNLKLAAVPGHVLLPAGEANLPSERVVNTSQVFTVHRSVLKEKLGSISPVLIEQVIQGVQLLITPNEVE